LKGIEDLVPTFLGHYFFPMSELILDVFDNQFVPFVFILIVLQDIIEVKLKLPLLPSDVTLLHLIFVGIVSHIAFAIIHAGRSLFG